MKKTLILLSFIGCVLIALPGQSQGISFSYIIPKNGYLSAPISPFSIRGVGFGGKYVRIETGFSLYTFPELPMTGLPFSSQKSLSGPSLGLLIPAEAALSIPIGKGKLKFLGGGFLMSQFWQKLNLGNLDRALSQMEGWDVANATAQLKSKPGVGWMTGVEIDIPVNRTYSFSFSIQYLHGSTPSPISGTYTGGTINGPLLTLPLDGTQARTLLEGLEISVGVSMRH
ncbi:MAG: hypothetical protein OEY56_13640 [Cyclobacteriaceae bacterium]|nr:hypothetical protein [Cyclobacteriaceae bacterium]